MNAVKVLVYPVSDLAATKAFFTNLLGADPYVDSPYYVGFRTGELEIGLAPAASQHGASSAIAYVDVADIKAALAALVAGGAEKVQDVTDVANGLLTAIVKNPDGTPVGLRQHPNS
ncbi:MAG TPA: VOC family protein [Candidatus Tumulicola sp.]|jgi:predicted enzyme related to lactoylglutathione lyase